MEPPGQDCEDLPCSDIPICLGISCTLPDPTSDIDISTPANLEPLPEPKPDEGDPGWGPRWFPPGMEPEAEPEPPEPPESSPPTTTPSDDDSEEEEPESPAEGDDEPKEEEKEKEKEKKDCGGENGGAGEGQGGSQATASNPVTLAWGQKSESATDVAVRLTGRDFSIDRLYTSDTAVLGPHLVGNNWTLSAFQGAYFNSTLNVIHVYSRNANRVIPFVSDGNGGWKAPGPGNQTITKGTLTFGGHTTYTLTEPGAGYRTYYRMPDSGEPNVTNPGAELVGLLAREGDAYGNKAEYTYELFGTGVNKKARLRKIVLNGNGTTAEAEIRFQWYLVVNDPMLTHPLNGKLARIQVIRYDGSTAYETDRVEYTYKHSQDPFSADVGTNGDLIQVARFSRVDDWEDDESEYLPSYPHRTFVTQYRYHDGDQVGTGDPRLEITGAARQLKSVFMPQQIEYYAQQLHRTAVLEHPSVAVRDAAYRLMLRGDNDLAFRDAASVDYKVMDVAAKIVGYDNTSGRVGVEYIQSACGCSGGGTQGLQQTFTYSEWTANSLWPYGGRATQIEEKYYDGSSYQLHRTLYYDMAPQSSTSDVPYLVNKVIKDTTGKTWIWHYKYDSERRVIEKYTPEAMDPSYTAATGTTASSYDTGAGGLVYVYDYTDTHRVKEMSVKEGSSGTPQVVTRIEYPTSSGTNTRVYLPTKVERFVVAGTSNEDEIQTTWFEYGFHGSTGNDPLAWRRTIVEREQSAEGGPESSDTGVQLYTPPGGSNTVVADSYELYDANGRLCWIRHADMSLTRRQFASGAVRPTSVTYNADPTALTSWPGSLTPSGWGSTYNSGATLTFEYEYNGQGRVTAMRGPGGVERSFSREYRSLGLNGSGEYPGAYYYVKREMPHELGTTGTYSGTSTITWLTAGGQLVASSEFTLDSTGAIEVPCVERRTIEYYLAGQVKRDRQWHDIARGLYYDTTYTYDSLGRRRTVTNPSGTVVQNDSYDVLDRVLQVSTGTGGTPTPVVAYYYDDPDTDSTPENGVGNGNLSWTVRFAGENRTSGDSGGGTSTELRTYRTFDFRNQLTVVQAPEAPHFAAAYDNLGRMTEVGLFTTVPTSVSSSNRGLYAKHSYSQRGLRYQTLIATDPANPTTYLGSYSWFDPVGRPLAQWEPNSPRVKTSYDGLGRPTTVWITDGASDPAPGASSNFAAAASVSDDIVLEQLEMFYDSRGREDLIAARVRLHDATAAGALTDSTSVVTYDGTYFDDADRPIRVVEFGTNQAEFQTGGTSPRSTWPPSSPPNWNDSAESRLITAIAYDARGHDYLITDSEGKRTKSGIDAMGRTVWTIENESSGSVSWSTTLGRWTATGMSSSDPSLNRVTSVVFPESNSSSMVVKQYAHHLNSSSVETVQTTQYEYGTTQGSTSNDLDSLVPSGHLLAKIRYPDPSTGAAGGDAQSVLYAYDRLGDMRATRDQNGTVHRFDRDFRGRVIKDRVTVFGSGGDVDQRIDEIHNRFDRLGRMDRVHSLDGSTVVNAVELTFSALGQIRKIYQDSDGQVDLGSGTNTATVEYTYAESGADNRARLASLVYPAAGTVTFGYGASGQTDQRISRVKSLSLSNLSASVTSLVSYDYLGLGFHAGVDLPLIDVQLDRTFTHEGKRRIRSHTSQTQGYYGGWDRFGRVAQQVWVDGGLNWPGGSATVPNKPPIIEEEYTYDRVGSRTAAYDKRPGASRATRDSEFSHDGLHRLKEAKRGKRVSGSQWDTGPDGQAWDLDMLGNWSKVKTDTTGDGLYTANFETEERGHDALNELVQQQLIATPSEPVRPLTYDDAGNLESHQKSAAITVKYTHDAWGRLVKIKHDLGSSIVRDVASYEYNGLHWRTRKLVDTNSDGTLDQERRLYYSAAWQLLQEDVDNAYATAAGVDEHVQYFWGLRYIDDILMHRRMAPAGEGGEGGEGGGGEDPPPEPEKSSYFHLTDVQFSTVALLDEAGRLVERVRYQAYGQGDYRWPGDFNRDGSVDSTDDDEIQTALNAGGYIIGDEDYEPDLDLDRDGSIDSPDYTLFQTWYGKSGSGQGLISDPSGPDNCIGYAGYVLNREALIYTVRHRHYEPMLGRFMETDPLGYIDGMNRYAYGLGSPASFVDPLGLKASRSSTEVLDDQNDAYCDAIVKARDQGKLCQKEFEKQWNNHHCGDPTYSVQDEIDEAWTDGFFKGAHDGFVVTTHHAIDSLTGGLYDLFNPLDPNDLYDPDNPMLEVSRICGQIAGECLGAAWGLARTGADVCLNACFAEGTLVATADGLRPIQEIEPGDLVWSFDEETGYTKLAPVVRTFEHQAQELIELAIGDQTIRVTAEHPIWVEGLGWMKGADLSPGLDLLLQSGGISPVLSTCRSAGARVFNLEVQGTHTYYVTQHLVLVHNACVYTGFRNGLRYIGRTSRSHADRAAEHLRDSGMVTNVVRGMENLTYRQSRAVEEALIVKYGLKNLDNKIHGINPNRKDYQALLKIGQDLLRKAGHR